MIELNPELEKRLNEEAQRAGLTASEYAQRLIDEALPEQSANNASTDPTIQWIERFEREEGTDDPEELARREKELEELKAAMNETRRQAGARPIFP